MAKLITRRAVLAGTTFVLVGGIAYAGYIEPAVSPALPTYRPHAKT